MTRRPYQVEADEWWPYYRVGETSSFPEGVVWLTDYERALVRQAHELTVEAMALIGRRLDEGKAS